MILNYSTETWNKGDAKGERAKGKFSNKNQKRIDSNNGVEAEFEKEEVMKLKRKAERVDKALGRSSIWQSEKVPISVSRFFLVLKPMI